MKMAHMYYEEGATQSEIAKAMGVSRSLISKYLTKAKEEGIVEIIIHDDIIHPFRKLEMQVERAYGIREVVCIPSFGGESSKSRLGAATAKYLLRVMQDGQVIGVSSGTTLFEVAKAMPSNQTYPSVRFVPLVGGVGNERVDIHANHIAATLARQLHSEYKLLHTPVMVDSKEAKKVFMSQSSIKSVFDLAAQADIALVGIGGAPEHSTMVRSYLGQEHQEHFAERDIVGDICANFINENGTVTKSSWNERIISLELEKLKEIPLVIGVASGKEKVQSIKAALKGNMIDVLMTDEETAKDLLLEQEKKQHD